MMRQSLSLIVLGVLALPGCPSSEPSSSNPTTLWLASVGSDETRVQLVDTEPPPF
jgi:hypothetical protein